MEMEISGTSEIVESNDRKAETCSVPRLASRFSIEDDINRLFEAIDIRSSVKGVGLHNGGSKEMLQKKAMKRPIRAGSPQSTGIGISEPVSLKQALRRLCISQASELAAMKRLSRPTSSSGTSETGNIKRLSRAVVVEANGSGLPLNEGKGNLVEFSLVPERISPISPENLFESSGVDKAESSDQSAHYSNDRVTWLPSSCGGEMSGAEGARPIAMDSSSVSHYAVGVKEVDMMASVEVLEKASVPEERKNQKDAPSSLSCFRPDSLVKTLACNSPRFIKPIFGNKNFSRKKAKQDSSSASGSCNTHNEKVENILDPGTSNSGSSTTDAALGSVREDIANASPECSSMDHSVELNSSKLDACSNTILSSSNMANRPRFILAKIDERSRLKEKGEFSQSSKSSVGEHSSSTSLSEDNSSLSGSNRSVNRPHMSRDLRWEAIRHVQKQYRSLCLKHFKLVKKLGCGDIGSVYLAELTGTNCLFALKVMDNEFLASRKKISRAQTEKEILQMLDHPFLPTLYAHFVSDKLSCLVMEYCPGGDLHVLRQKQPGRCFSEQAVRFYAAEVLLAIEYLHMLGVVYRDLKPENVLVREDGHIMLSDFDLSLRCSVNPIVVQSSSLVEEPARKTSSPCSESSCIEPFCLHPAWQVSCFTPRLLSVASKSRKMKLDLAAQMSPLPQLVVEPTGARSNSFVGTYEYLAPEIIKGEGHGSAVDWWTFGIFLFELLYGKTPFKGSSNEETLSNVVSRSLRFPSSPVVTFHARDLIRGLLVKEPENRLGSGKGAVEIKQHSFFDGLNWALIRCAVPPELPKPHEAGTGAPTAISQNKDGAKGNELKGTDDYTEFEMF